MMWWMLAASAWACGEPEPGLYVEEEVGWTPDGAAYVVKGTEENGRDRREVYAVFDTRTDSVKLLAPDAFEAFRQAYPLAHPTGSGACEGAVARVRFDNVGGHPGVTLPTPKETATRLPPEASVVSFFEVERDGVVWPHGEWSAGSNYASVRWSWSPDCRFVAWVVDDLGSASKVTVRPVGPIIHVMAHRSAPESVDPIVNALIGRGLSPHVGPKALKDREATVVYTSAASAEVAKTVAAAVPGGATVEPLSWTTPADIIVAAGRSAVP